MARTNLAYWHTLASLIAFSLSKIFSPFIFSLYAAWLSEKSSETHRISALDLQTL
jgi:hypothetical protein